MTYEQGARPRWILALLLVIVGHLLFALSARHWQQSAPVAELPAALLIELAPTAPAAKAAVQPPVAKPAAKPTVQPPAKAKPLASQAKPQSQAAKPIKPLAADLPAPASASPSPSSPAATAAAAPSQASAKVAQDNWQNQLLSHLARYKRYPEDARRRGVHGLNSLHLVIDGAGQIETFALVTLSGSPSLDRATLQMIRRAQPVPAPPKALLEDGRVEVIAPISYTLDQQY